MQGRIASTRSADFRSRSRSTTIISGRRGEAPAPRSGEGGQFPEDAHAAFRAIREGHFWFETRKRALQEVLHRLMPQSEGRTLEIGCGDGYLLPVLPGRYKVGADASIREVLSARALTGIASVVVTTGIPMPFKSTFSLVGAFDVIEHVEDDMKFVRECAATLVAGGLLALTVPAWPSLWSHLDVYAGHYRRYRPKTLRSLLRAAALEIELMVPLFRTLWPLAYLSARLRRNRRVADTAAEFSVGPLANRILKTVLAAEWRSIGLLSFGRGTSLLAVARKHA
ncbi:MAG: class I SAM-dependent methyltransferase [Acidobacteriota bacterium]